MIGEWTENLENNVKIIGEKSTGYKIMHIKAAQESATFYDRIMYLGISLGPLAGLLSGIGSALDPDAPITFPIISSCVAFLSGVVVAFIKFGKWDEITTAHKNAAAKYTSLESNVRRQLALPRGGRSEPATYVRWVGDSFDELFLASPLIRSKIYTAYAKTAVKAKLTVPDEYGLMVPIDPKYDVQQAHRRSLAHSITINHQEVKNEEEGEVDKKEDGTEKEQGSPEAKAHLDINVKTDRTPGVRRSNKLRSIPELNQYSAGKMEYEMKRLMGN